jgi:hypothetical protein
MKRFLDTSEASTSKKVKVENAASSEFLTSLQNHRLKAAASISEFKFNKRRVKILSKVKEILVTSSKILTQNLFDFRPKKSVTK